MKYWHVWISFISGCIYRQCRKSTSTCKSSHKNNIYSRVTDREWSYCLQSSCISSSLDQGHSISTENTGKIVREWSYCLQSSCISSSLDQRHSISTKNTGKMVKIITCKKVWTSQVTNLDIITVKSFLIVELIFVDFVVHLHNEN